MDATLAQAWRDVVLHPRARVSDHVRAGPRNVLLVLPLCAGVLQSFVQGATNSVGLQGSVLSVFAFAVPIGVVWGLLQVHLLAACLWAVARRDNRRIPFRMARHVVALATAPAATAFLAWLTVAVMLGRIVFVNPEAWDPSAISLSTSLTMTLVYLGSALSVLWGFVVLAFGVREATATSMAGAVGTIMKAGLVLFGVCFMAVAVVIAGVILV